MPNVSANCDWICMLVCWICMNMIVTASPCLVPRECKSRVTEKQLVAGNTWKEIVPNKHAEQHEIIDHTLQIKSEWQCVAFELQL